MATKNRPSPIESATIFDIGTKRRGNDDHMYVVTTDKNGKHRWTKHKGEDIEETPVIQKVDDNDPKHKPHSKKEKLSPIHSDASDSDAEVSKPKKSSKKVVKKEPKTPEISDDSEEEKQKASKEKKKHTRKAPADQAKKYDIGETKMGIDGNIYIVKETKNNIKRWFLQH